MNDPLKNPRREQLYRLLPRIYQVLDSENVPDNKKGPLRELLSLIGEQVNLLEDDLARWYDNWFIETCEDWVVPYIGDLIGYESAVQELNTEDDPESPLNRMVVFPRREVAETIALRRRKGTLALLEELSLRIVGWPARAVEYKDLTAGTASVNHLNRQRSSTVDFRNGFALALLGTPFDQLSRTVDVRRINSHRTQGRCNLSAIGLHVYRRSIESATLVPAYNCGDQTLEDVGRFTFSPLGLSRQLHQLPVPETSSTSIAGPENLPVAITRRMLRHPKAKARDFRINKAYYGVDKSLVVFVREDDNWKPVEANELTVTNLSSWQFPQDVNQKPKPVVAIDPELGRLLFDPDFAPPQEVQTFHYFSRPASIGGGEYDRLRHRNPDESEPDFRLSVAKNQEVACLKTAFQIVTEWLLGNPQATRVVIEIADSCEYVVDEVTLAVPDGVTLEITSSNRCQPLLQVPDTTITRTESFHISGGPDSRLILDGLMFSRGRFRVSGDFAEVVVRDCTFQPGHAVIVSDLSSGTLQIERSILGHLHNSKSLPKRGRKPKPDPVSAVDPPLLFVQDSILDPMAAVSERADTDTADAHFAIGDHDRPAYVRLRMVRSTVLGQITAHVVDRLENCIFTEPIRFENRQAGCVRFSYVAEGSQTPPQFHCQPALSKERRKEALSEVGKAQARFPAVAPRFMNKTFGTADYARLSDDCPIEIRQGADDEGEMGVYHNEFYSQRATQLRQRLQEFVPAGSDIEIIFES